MKSVIWIFGFILAVLAASVAEAQQRPIPRDSWSDETKVWLARSCVGESGFSAVEECVGIAWVYATIVEETNSSLRKVILSYSSAVKPREKHRRPWIFDLNLEGEKPRHWPENLSWKVHSQLWKKILFELDQWSKGYRENPVPGANHYGGHMDSPGKYWRVVVPRSSVAFNNTFYQSGGSSRVAENYVKASEQKLQLSYK